MPATRPIDDLRKEAARLITEEARRRTFGRAAQELHISRQALYDIENGTYCPSLALIHRACKEWNLTFTYRGLTISEASTVLRTRRKDHPEERQLGLFEALGELEKKKLEVVRAKRTSRGIELTLRLSLSA